MEFLKQFLVRDVTYEPVVIHDATDIIFLTIRVFHVGLSTVCDALDYVIDTIMDNRNRGPGRPRFTHRQLQQVRWNNYLRDYRYRFDQPPVDGSGDYFTGRRALENLYLDDEDTVSTTETDTDESSIDSTDGSFSGSDSDMEGSTDTENSRENIDENGNENNEDGEENN